MKYIFLFLLSTAITGSMCAQELSVFRYEVDVIQNPDTFFITLTPEKLKKEATFFDDIAEMTYPEIRLFFDNYVLKAGPLPYEYFGKVGLKLERNDDGTPVVRKLKELTPEQEQLFGVWSRNLER